MGRSQRHKIIEQGYAFDGAPRAQGEIAPKMAKGTSTLAITAVTKAAKTIITVSPANAALLQNGARIRVLGTALTQLDFATAGLLHVENVNTANGQITVKADTSGNGTTPTLGTVQMMAS
jgi:hypothetical protein